MSLETFIISLSIIFEVVHSGDMSKAQICWDPLQGELYFQLDEIMLQKYKLNLLLLYCRFLPAIVEAINIY